MYTVWTINYNRDGSVNNETLEGEYTDRDEALKKAKAVNGEVREHNTLDSMYDEGYSIVSLLTIKDIRLMTGLSARKFGEKYHIPTRTIENWEMGVRSCPVYVLELLERAVKEDFKRS